MKGFTVGLVFLGAFVAGCGGSSTPTVTASGGENVTVPTPDEDQRAALLTGLRKINTGLVVNEDRAVSRARDTCLDIIEGKPPAALQTAAAARYEGGTVPKLTPAEAGQIVAAVRSSFCS